MPPSEERGEKTKAVQSRSTKKDRRLYMQEWRMDQGGHAGLIQQASQEDEGQQAD